MPKRKVLTALIALVAMIAAAPAAAGGKTYKWVDDDGAVHYGDRVPAEHSDKRREVMNEDGVVVETLEAASSPEEREARHRARQQASRQARRDRMLEQSYDSEEALIRDRAKRFENLNAQISILREAVDESDQSLERMEADAAGYRERDAKVPGKLRRQIEAERERRRINRQAMDTLLDELERVREQFRQDLARYRELTDTDPQRTEQR